MSRRGISRRMAAALGWRGGAVIGLCLGALAVLSLAVRARLLDGADAAALLWLDATIPDRFDGALRLVYAASGKAFTAVLVLAVLVALAAARRWREIGVFAFGTGGILAVVDLMLKPVFARPRPPGALLDFAGGSFPSGHAAGSVVFYFLAVALVTSGGGRWRRPLFAVAGLWVAMIWASTLYTHAHWPSDLVAGGAVGLAWLVLSLAIRRGLARDAGHGG